MTTITIAAIVTLLMVTVALTAEGYDGMVGGRMEIKDVKSNKEVQELGRFCVEEYNNQRLKLRLRGVSRSGEEEEELKFRGVVAAERQVVAGIKYYLKISAATQDGVVQMFNSVVVVKAWLRYKKLLNFAPASRC